MEFKQICATIFLVRAVQNHVVHHHHHHQSAHHRGRVPRVVAQMKRIGRSREVLGLLFALHLPKCVSIQMHAKKTLNLKKSEMFQ